MEHTRAKEFVLKACVSLSLFDSFKQPSAHFSKTIYSLLLLFSFGIFSGCSMDASIQSLSQEIEQILSRKPTSMEVTSSSSQGVYTTKGYEVQSSVSYYNVKSEVVTSKGYTVQTNIQSTLFKE